MVPLGRALQAAGHEVTVMCCPAFTRTVRRTGLPVAAVLNDEDPVFWMRLWHLLRVQSGAAAPGAGTLLHPSPAPS
jgi:EryCIII-like glycosyltransferase